MKTIEVNKVGNLWYVIVKENGVNIALASFTTKKAATATKANWMTQYADLHEVG